MESTLYRNTKQHNVSSECFGLLTYQTTKQHAKHPLWRNKITLTKMCIFSVFSVLCTKKPKCRQNYLYAKQTAIEINVLCVSELVRYQSTKCLKSTLSGEAEQLYQKIKRVILVFSP